jgi:hypothetical protein
VINQRIKKLRKAQEDILVKNDRSH